MLAPESVISIAVSDEKIIIFPWKIPSEIEDIGSTLSKLLYKNDDVFVLYL